VQVDRRQHCEVRQRVGKPSVSETRLHVQDPVR
jgi:hypothetical protein